MAPTSTAARPASFRPAVEIDGKTALVLVEQTTAVDPQRLGARVGTPTGEELASVNRALRTVLGLH